MEPEMKLKLVTIARILHVLGVVVWIGGVSFVTLVLIPALKRYGEDKKRFEIFQKLEGRFAPIARWMVGIVGITGIYMMEYARSMKLPNWERYLSAQYWWITLMTFVWLIFFVVLFILEPLVLHKRFHQMAETGSEEIFKRMTIMHIVLLTLSLIAVLGAVGGVHGLFN